MGSFALGQLPTNGRPQHPRDREETGIEGVTPQQFRQSAQARTHPGSRVRLAAGAGFNLPDESASTKNAAVEPQRSDESGGKCYGMFAGGWSYRVNMWGNTIGWHRAQHKGKIRKNQESRRKIDSLENIKNFGIWAACPQTEETGSLQQSGLLAC